MTEQPVGMLIEDEFPGEWGGSNAGAGLCEAFVLRATNFVNRGLDYSTSARRFIPSTKVDRKRLRKGDLVLEAAGGGPGVPVGRVACFDPPDDRVYLVSNFFRTLRPTTGTDSRFAFHLLDDLYRQPKIWEVQQQTTGIINLKVRDYLRFPVRVPPLEEQRRIAEILDTIDETIQATERVIAKLRSLSDGLSQALFAADRSYPLRSLAEFTVKIQDGTHFSPTSARGPFRYVTSKNIRMGFVDISTATWISESEHRNIYRRCDTRSGDVLLTKDGANTGNVAVNEMDEEISLLSSVAMLRCDETSSSGRYLYHYLASADGQRQMAAAMAGNAITRLTLVKIRRLLIPAPPIQEQQQVVVALDSLGTSIWAARGEYEKLRSTRVGLASDLLSGRVRTAAA